MLQHALRFANFKMKSTLSLFVALLTAENVLSLPEILRPRQGEAPQFISLWLDNINILCSVWPGWGKVWT
jgi:hypothetical protein